MYLVVVDVSLKIQQQERKGLVGTEFEYRNEWYDVVEYGGDNEDGCFISS